MLYVLIFSIVFCHTLLCRVLHSLHIFYIIWSCCFPSFPSGESPWLLWWCEWGCLWRAQSLRLVGTRGVGHVQRLQQKSRECHCLMNMVVMWEGARVTVSSRCNHEAAFYRWSSGSTAADHQAPGPEASRWWAKVMASILPNAALRYTVLHHFCFVVGHCFCKQKWQSVSVGQLMVLRAAWAFGYDQLNTGWCKQFEQIINCVVSTLYSFIPLGVWGSLPG